jgi:hypothetical protein
MIKILWQKPGLLRRAEFLSARDLLQRAGGISGLFLLAHLAGLREFTSVLNGTTGSLAAGVKLGAFLAAVYILLYLAFVILVPVLVLAAALLAVGRRYIQKEKTTL